jgi:nucleoside 2-deoxyribosyltransferase
MAGPLFTFAERMANSLVAGVVEKELRSEFDIDAICILPQDRADDFLPDLAAVVRDCLDQVDGCELVLACLDGPDADSGTCAEIGYARGLGKPVVGYRTDFRGSEVDGVNAMLRHMTDAHVLVPSHSIGLAGLAAELAQAVAAVLVERGVIPTTR